MLDKSLIFYSDNEAVNCDHVAYATMVPGSSTDMVLHLILGPALQIPKNKFETFINKVDNMVYVDGAATWVNPSYIGTLTFSYSNVSESWLLVIQCLDNHILVPCSDREDCLSYVKTLTASYVPDPEGELEVEQLELEVDNNSDPE